jgi:hypothetical protein
MTLDPLRLDAGACGFGSQALAASPVVLALRAFKLRLSPRPFQPVVPRCFTLAHFTLAHTAASASVLHLQIHQVGPPNHVLVKASHDPYGTGVD